MLTETDFLVAGLNILCIISFRKKVSLRFWKHFFSILATSIDLENAPSPSNSVEKAVKTEKLIKDGKPRVPTAARKNCKDKPTRVRTVLNEKQLSTLKRCYAANPRPDSVMKEQLVEMTGLSPRVIRVWFQNKRCKDKKRMMMNGGDGKIGVRISVIFLRRHL